MGKQPPDDEPAAGRGKPLPQCKAFLLCERIIIEEGTRKPTLIGAFNSLHLPDMPLAPNLFWAFLQMVDGIGEYDFTLEIHDLALDEIASRAPIGRIAFPSRPSRLSLAVPVRPLTIQHAGKFDVVILVDGRELERQQFDVTLKGEEQQNGEEASES